MLSNRLQASLPANVEWNEETMQSSATQREDPLSLLIRQEAAERVRSALWALPPHYRIVIELRHFQALDYESIAAEVGLPLSSVKTHLFRARRMLAEWIRKKESEDESIPSG